MSNLNKEYWQKRCELAEAYLDTLRFHTNNPLYPDKEDILARIDKSQDAYIAFKSSPDAIELYSETDKVFFEALLNKKGMWYTYCMNEDDMHEISFWYRGTDYTSEGCIITGSTLESTYRSSLRCIIGL